jgi:hypothetical protein
VQVFGPNGEHHGLVGRQGQSLQGGIHLTQVDTTCSIGLWMKQAGRRLGSTFLAHFRSSCHGSGARIVVGITSSRFDGRWVSSALTAQRDSSHGLLPEGICTAGAAGVRFR